MTPERITELRAIIAGDPELAALAASGNDVELAAALSAALPRIPKPESMRGDRGFYQLLGAQAGEAFLQTIATLAATESPMRLVFVRVNGWINSIDGIDVGDKEFQDNLLSLTAPNGPFAAETVGKIIAFGSQQQTFTIEEVSQLR